MPLYVIAFPNFDPVLTEVGTFAIRWYALAYIVGILAGWIYARTLVRSERLVALSVAARDGSES
jgi:phosphatidylglycerol:prolipoprotein diacylglycerol transferase